MLGESYENSLKQVPSLWTYLHYETLSDVRTKNWLLVDSPWIIAVLFATYWLMVLQLPKLLHRRQPLQMRPVLIVYNLVMTLLNVYICKELLVSARRLEYNFWCQPCRVIYSKDEMKIAAAVWWFYISKLIEFSDTLFFILRKKTEQLNFLHVYHHSTMFPLWWIAIKWVPTGSTFFPALINSFVHIIMYSYYGLTAVGKEMQRYLWWKKYITVLQLLQFTVGLLWAIQAIVRKCTFPPWISYLTAVYMITFLILFGQFFVQKYQRKVKA